MFFISAAVILVFVIAGIVFPETFQEKAEAIRDGIGEKFGWFYLLATSFFLVFVVWLMISRFGRIRLGPDSSRPEFGTLAWFAMLFTAGMGIGLVFYGVTEPVWDAVDTGIVPEGASVGDATTTSMQYTLFHWGFHPWAIYIVVGAALGYFCFRKGLPMRPASALYPLIGNRIYGWIGNLIDILAVFGTLFGLATSLGLGTQQINTGLSSVLGMPNNAMTQTGIVCLITAIAIVSVVAGIDKGIRRLSVINLWLAAALMLFVFILGPKLWMLSIMTSGAGAYLQNLVDMSLTIMPTQIESITNGASHDFSITWTIFYWGWWISWSPFVGMFLARISYGRTLRQFITGTLFAPVGVTVVWFGVFGGAGMFYDQLKGAGISDVADQANGMYALMEEFPVPGIIISLVSLLAVLVVTVFFVTSSDSGSLVVDMLTNGGDPHPVRIQRIFWATTEGLVTIVLLVAGGSAALAALQAAAVTTGLPFAIVLIFIVFGLLKALKQEDPASLYPDVQSPRLANGKPSHQNPEAGETVTVGTSTSETSARTEGEQ